MERCVYCLQELPSKGIWAKICKNCGRSQEEGVVTGSKSVWAEPEVGGCLKPTLWICGIAIVLSLILSPFSFGGGSGSGAAKGACHSRVESGLKAPSTARFSSTVSKHDTRDNDFLVEGTVDAQNSFGATVRSSFQCVVDTSGSSPRVTLNYLR
jgi:hypothetical protein